MKSSTLVILLVVLAVLLLCCCVAVALGAVAIYGGDGPRISSGWSILGRGSWESTTSYSRELAVQSPAVVTVVNEVGRVNVRGGAGNSVSVRAEARARASTQAAANQLLEEVLFDASASGNQAEIRVDVPSSLVNQSLSVTLDITVPRSSSLDVRSNVGEIRIEGLEGVVTVTGDVGDIVLHDVALTGDSEIRSGVGDVTFDGQLPESGQVSVNSNVGSTRIVLPRGSQFLLDASTNVGEIDVSFDVQDRETGGERIVRRELRGRVGTDPQVTLMVRAGTGGIEIESR